MARQILPIAGQIIGGMVGGPVGAAIGGAIGSVVGNAIDPQIIKGPKLGDGQVQTSAEGVYRPIVLGTGAVMGNIIHRGPEVVRTHRESQGKGSGPKVESERRYRTFAIRVAEGPIAGILRIWMDEKLVYDIRTESEIPAESDQFAEGFRLYLGGEDQLPDPGIEAYLGVGNVNAYRGTAYIVFPNFDLTDYGDRIPQFRFEVVGTSSVQTTGSIAIRRSGSGAAFYSRSPDGRGWGPWISQNQINTRIIPGRDRFVSMVNLQPYRYTESGMQGWATSDGVTHSGTSGTHKGWADLDGVFVAPTGGSGAQRSRISRDNASSFDLTSGESPVLQVCKVGAIWIGRRNDLFYRATDPDSWIEFAQEPDLSWGSARWSNGDLAMFGGADSPSNGTPTVYANAGGMSLEKQSIPSFSNSTQVSALCYGMGFWIAATDGGEIGYRDSSGWHLSDFVFPGNCSEMSFNGSRIIAAVEDGSTGYIFVCEGDPDSWDEVWSGDIGFSGSLTVGSLLPRPFDSGISLSDVVQFLHRRTESDSFDAAVLSDVVDGVVLSGDYTAADCIRTLMSVYMFDASEHDAGVGYRINYAKRGGPVVATITADDLVDEPEESVREDALERPKKLHMHFQSPTVGYAPAKATSMRNSPDVLVTGEVSVSVPVVFSDVDEAWQRAGVMHQVAWSEVAGTQELVLSDSWLELVPTDNIGLVLRDQQRRLRITKVEHVEGTLKCEMMTDRQSSYTSNLTGVPLPDPTPPPPSIVGPTEFAFLDIPALTDSGDRLLYYVAVSGQSPAWHGAVIQRSMDGGANYEDVLTVRQNTIMGTLVDPVSDASEHYTDTTNVVRVELFTEDELQSLTQQQFLSEGGAFALEKPGGGWEVMQYRDADQNMDGDWELSTLLRGRLNSGTDEHLAGARFVLLDGVYAVGADVGMIGQDLTHRAVSLGTSPEVAPVSTDTYTAQSQTEWPVAHILSDGVDSGSLPVQIIPRHRFGTEDHPVSSINWQGFRITATDGSNTVTIDTLSDTHTFSVGGWSDPITVTASQLNRFTGAGPSVSEEFE